MTEHLPPPNLLERISRFRRWYRGSVLRGAIERWHPFALGVVAGVLGWKAGLTDANVRGLLDKVLSDAVSVAAVLAGFQATAQSVMMSLIESPAWAFLKKVKHDRVLVSYHWTAIWTLLAFVGVSLGFLALDAVGYDVTKWTRLVPATLALLIVWGAAANIRIIRLMADLLRNKDELAKRAA